MLGSVEQVRALRPDFGALRDLKLGVVAPCELDEDTTFEVRAFVPGLGINEDPVTGSLNAGIAQWLIGAGLAPYHYVVSQGSALGREGRVHVDRQGGDIWVGGDVVVCIEGQVSL
jgi:PhzF family phenazine biosynthesis protein